MKRLGLWLVALGIVAVAVGTIVTWGFLGRLLTADTHAVPGTFEEKLDPGTYLISLQTGSSRSVGVVSFSQSVSVGIDELQISGPNGEIVVARPSGNETVERNGTSFRGVAVFDARTEGVYVISLTPTRPTNALVTRSLRDVTLVEWLGVGTGGLGVIAAFVGVILAIVGWVRDRDLRRAAERTSSLPPPPGGPPV